MTITPDTNPVNLKEVTYTVATDTSTLAGYSYVLSTAAGATIVDSACTAVYTATTLITCTPEVATTMASVTALGLTATQSRA